MLTNTTDRTLLSCGVHYAPGDPLPSDAEIADLPEWDAVRRACERGEIQSVVSSELGAPVASVPVSPPVTFAKDSTIPLTASKPRKGRRKTE